MYELLQKALIILRSLTSDPRIILFLQAKKCLGKKLTVTVDKEYGCMESMDRVYFKATGRYINGNILRPEISTTRGYYTMLNSKKFIKVLTPRAGSIIISPTGLGNGSIKNGHTGCVSTNGLIMSNSSNSGLWEENWTINGWNNYYGVKGGFPIYFFDVV